MAVGALAVTSPAPAQVPQDAVYGVGSTSLLQDLDVAVTSGPSGENPTGNFDFFANNAAFRSTAITCLSVHGNTAVVGVMFAPNGQPVSGAVFTLVDNGPFFSGLDTIAIVGTTPATTCPPPATLPGAPVEGGDIGISDAQPDNEPPRLAVPNAVTANARSLSGTRVDYAATATDNVDANPEVVCTPPSGSVFPIGTSRVTCTATDDAGNEATQSFSVTVRLPTGKDECKSGGWLNFGTVFKNQGDCVRFVNHQARQQCIFIRARHGRPAFRTFFRTGIQKRHAMRRCIEARSTG